MIVLPTSPVPTIVGLLSLVSYPTLLSHPTLINHGSAGAVLSTVNTGVLVLLFVFPNPSVTVIVCAVPLYPLPTTAVQLILPLASPGLGLQLNHGILTIAPLSTLLNHTVTVVPLLAGFGLITPTTGSLGHVLSILTLKFVPVLSFPAPSVAVTVHVYVPSPNTPLIVILQSPAPSTTPV